jgi:hypothetical protein
MNEQNPSTRQSQPPTFGFAGLGTKGEAMALWLVAAGVRRVAWNPKPERCATPQAAGAQTAPELDSLLSRCDPDLLMLADVEAIRVVLGVTPMQCVGGWRLHNAHALLECTERSVRQIALKVGYESESAFNRALKEQFGAPPGRFRRALQVAEGCTGDGHRSPWRVAARPKQPII